MPYITVGNLCSSKIAELFSDSFELSNRWKYFFQMTTSHRECCMRSCQLLNCIELHFETDCIVDIEMRQRVQQKPSQKSCAHVIRYYQQDGFQLVFWKENVVFCKFTNYLIRSSSAA